MPLAGHHCCVGLGRNVPASPKRPARQCADPTAVTIDPGACIDQDITKKAAGEGG